MKFCGLFRYRSYGLSIAMLSITMMAILGPSAFALADCGTVPNLSIPVGPSGCDVVPGIMKSYDAGDQPSVAMISDGMVVEFHKSENNDGLYYHVGKRKDMAVAWGPSHRLRLGSDGRDINGSWPQVAMTNDGTLLEVHADSETRNGANLYYRVGKLNPNGDQSQTIQWMNSDWIRWDGGFHASISMVVINGVYTIVGVHEVDGPFNDRRAFYRVGHLSNPGAGNYTITWTSGSTGINYTNAINPHIALNTKGQVVEVHEAPNSLRLHYIRGILSQGKIQWGGEDQPDYAETSERPAVTLNDNGIVTEVHTTLGGVIHMARLMGTLNSDGDTIDWSVPANFEELTTYPSLSSNGSSVLLSARNERSLYYTVSALADRNNWMGDMMPEIGEKTLSQIVIPGSHDAGMYCDGGTSQLGQTQDQDIYAQLQGGVRFFDLRVKQGNPQRIYHGPVTCDPLTRVMDDVAKFMGEGHKEAVVLEFSHWDGFGDACPTVAGAYEQFRDTVYSRIGRWMYREPTHPAQVDLTDLLSDGGKVIVLIDRFALAACNQQEAGFYVYQGWGTAQERLSQGEFTVLDSYSNTTDYSFMKTDQLQLFANFTGRMEHDSTYPCDLFLLSWTLTPVTNVYHYSKEANRNLADVMSETNANFSDKIPNILFVDYYQLARATDVAIAMTNRLLTP